ncbi:hypothetical protein D3C77_524770 [compost metagenome]
MIRHQIQSALDPATQRIAAAIHHRIGKILGLVLMLRRHHGIEHFPPRSHQRILPDPTHHHHHDKHRKQRRQRQPEKTEDHHQRHRHQQNTDAQLARQMPGDEHLGKNRQKLHDAVNQTKHLGLFGTAAEVLGHQPCLFEVQEGTDTGQQHHKQRNRQQVG